MNNILIIGAHFDDAELGAGGTAAKLVKMGKKVYKLTLTDNVTDFKNMKITVAYEPSLRQSANACKVLGIEEITDFQPERCCQLFYSTPVMQKVEDIIFKLNIDTVFMHYYDDMNQDHVEASRICKTASRHCKNVLMYQSNGYILEHSFTPTVFFDISEELDQKVASLNCYEGDHNRFNRLFDTVIQRNNMWGYANKVRYAEGFVPLRMIIE
ncbi:MAG: PIG-L family deacetylase [Bacteroidales bacterium]|nr:PIG-L family deacetylase [Bacteroidales bacterium]